MPQSVEKSQVDADEVNSQGALQVQDLNPQLLSRAERLRMAVHLADGPSALSHE